MWMVQRDAEFNANLQETILRKSTLDAAGVVHQQSSRRVLLSAELLVWRSIQKIRLWQLTICEDIQTGLGLFGAS